MASGDTLCKFIPQQNEPPGSNAATPDRRNYHPCLDMALDEEVVFSDVLPRNYGGGGITVYMHYSMSTAVANDIRIDTSFERIGDQQQDIDSDGFATAETGTDTTVPGTSGNVDIINNPHTDGGEIDNIAVGEGFRIKLKREQVAGTDASGDLELRFVELKET